MRHDALHRRRGAAPTISVPLALSRRETAIGVLLFLILLVCYTYTFPRWADWNQNSRLNLTMAIVDRGVLYIDDYYQGHTQTGDYAEYDGHVYSDKAPGAALLGVPFYWVFRTVTGTEAFRWLVGHLQGNAAISATLTAGGTGVLPAKVHAAAALATVTLGVVAIPSALLGVLLYRYTRDLTTAIAPRVAAVLLYGLATSAYPYSGSFYGHQMVAATLFAAFFLAYRLRRGPGGPPSVFGVGLLLAWAVISEYPAALIAAVIGVYLAVHLRNRARLAWALAGAALPIALWMAHNMAIFGRPMMLGYSYSTLYLDKHNVGFMSLTYPSLASLWGITFGSFRGLFYLSPILLIALPGFVLMARQAHVRAEALVCLAAFIAFMAFNASSVMWEGGFAVGPRYLVPMLPFMVPPLLVALESLGRSHAGRAVTALLAAWSFVAVWAETLGGQSFPDWTPDPLFQYSLERLAQGDVARNVGTVLGLRGLTSLLPLGVIVGALLIALAWVAGRPTEAGAITSVKHHVRVAGALHEPD
ncbi:MAG TPA: hypothetical protein GX714_01000 [Chloroflexi bacterium]|jgi:hypothetical protein|nr:hypothetical protein [Chloroflexota bacterium]